MCVVWESDLVLSPHPSPQVSWGYPTSKRERKELRKIKRWSLKEFWEEHKSVLHLGTKYQLLFRLSGLDPGRRAEGEVGLHMTWTSGSANHLEVWLIGRRWLLLSNRPCPSRQPVCCCEEKQHTPLSMGCPSNGHSACVSECHCQHVCVCLASHCTLAPKHTHTLCLSLSFL